MPTVAAAPSSSISIIPRGTLRVFGLSAGAVLGALMTLFGVLMFGARDAEATTYSLTSTAPTTNWSDTTKWTGGSGTYPGQNGPGDIVSIGLTGFTLNVDVTPYPVVLQISGSSLQIVVAAGKTLTLQTGSSMLALTTISVPSGATLACDTGANVSLPGTTNVSGGTLMSNGTLTFPSGSIFNFSGGTVTGSGVTAFSSGSTTTLSGSNGSMTINGTTINDSSSSFTYNSPTNGLALSNNASFVILSGGTFTVATDVGISGGSSEIISILSGGTMQKTSGSGSTAIGPVLLNAGTLTGSTGSAGGFTLNEAGTHSGTFNGPLTFAASQTFNSGTSFGGSGAVTITGGTQTFNAPVTASSGLTWSGGTIAGTGTLSIPFASSLVMNGATAPMTLLGAISSSTNVTYAPTVVSHLLTIDGPSGVLETTTPGSLSIAGDYDILSTVSGGTLRITGSSSVTKTGGTTGSTIAAYVDLQSGTLGNSSTAPLNLSGGGSSAGTISTGSGGSINFTNGSFTQTGTFSGSGSINVEGGTLSIDTPTSFSAPSLNVHSGTLTGTGSIAILSPMTWAGGTISGSAGFTVTSTGSLSITGSVAPMILDGRTITNSAATIAWSSASNSLTLKNSASIANGGTFAISSNGGTIDTDGSATSFVNSGTFNENNILGTFVMKPAFNHSGSLNVSSILDLQGGGTSSANFNLMAGATSIWFSTPAASTYTMNSGTSITGGSVLFKGPGTVLTDTALSMPSTSVTLMGGTLDTTAAMSLSGTSSFRWKGGTLTGAGHLLIGSGVSLDMTAPSAARTMSGYTIDNSGNATLDASTFPPSFDSGSTFNNNASGTLDIQSDGSFNTNGTGSNTFANAGSVKKSSGGSGFRFDVRYDQSAGSTDANSTSSNSTIIFAGGGTLSGGTIKATNATNNVDFFAGTYTLSGAALNGGAPGPVRITGSAAVNVNSPTSTTNFVQNDGTLAGTANLTVSSGGTYTWNGGTMGSGSGQLAIASGGTLDVAGAAPAALSLASHTINSSGTITYHPQSGGQGNQLTLSGAGSIVVQSGSTLDLTDGSNILASGASTTIGNSGTIQKLTSTSSSIAPTITNNTGGTIKPGAGTISLLSGTSNGTLDAGSGATLNFPTGSVFGIAGGTWGGSGGTFAVSGGTVTFGASYSLSGLALSAGQIDGSGALTLSGTNTWNGGTMAGGTGSTTVTGTLTMANTSNSTLDARTLTNNGTINYQAGGAALLLQNAATIHNNSQFVITGDANISCNCAAPSIIHNNSGATFKQSTTSGGATLIAPPFNNDGAVTVLAGELQFYGNGSHTGTFTLNGTRGASFLGTSTFSPASSFNGVASVNFTGPTTLDSSSLTLGGMTINGGNVAMTTPATVGTFGIANNGTLSGAGALTIAGGGQYGVSEFAGGTITGTGLLTVNSGVNFQFDGITDPMTVDGRHIINNGTMTYAGSTNGLTMANGAILTNASGATLNLDGTASINASGAGSTITSAGTIARGTTGTLSIAPAVTNSGTVNVNAGQLAFSGGYAQSAGSTNLLGGSIYSPSAIALAGGTLTGNGTVFAPVNNSGATIAPGTGLTPGTVTIAGNYTQGSGASMNVELAGATSYDVVDVSSSAVNLAGNLNVSLINGYTPAANTTFDVLKFASRSGDFNQPYNTPTFPGGGQFQPGYVSGTPNALRLTAVQIQADLAIAHTTVPSSVVHGQSATWTVTITNNGTSGATNIVVTDTFTNATFISAGSTGPCTPSGSTITCNISSLASGQSFNVALLLQASASGTITNSASVTASEFDPTTANNATGTASTTVLPSADVSLSIAAPPSAVNAGSALSYVVTVNNAGPDATAGTISVANTLPAGASSASASGSGWTCGAPSGGSITCTRSASIASGGSASFTVTMTAPASGPAVDSATMTSATADPDTSNNSASASANITPQADLKITKSGPPTVGAGGTLVYTITATNLGPSDASAVTVSDATPNGTTFVSNAGGCTTAFPCSLGTLTAGQSVTITSTFTAATNFTGASITNTAGVASSVTADPVTTNNSASSSATYQPAADLQIAKEGREATAPGATIQYTITITNAGPGAAANVTVTDPTPAGLAFQSNSGACTTPFPCSIGNLAAGQTATIFASYTVAGAVGDTITNTANASSTTFDPSTGNNTATTSTTVGAAPCSTQPPALVAPANGATVSSPVTFSWSAVAGATGYKLFASFGGAATQEIASTASTTFTTVVPNGSVSWSVQAIGVANCGALSSSTGTFNVCGLADAPVLSVIATSTAGQSYTVQWSAVAGVTTYSLEEAPTAAFDTNVQTITLAGTSRTFTKDVTVATPFFYRVRGITLCNNLPGTYSAAERVVVVPVPPPTAPSSGANVDINNKQLVSQKIFVPGQGPATPFSAASDQPWITITPSSGILPPEGITLTVTADPADLPNGTFTATVIITLGGAGKNALDTRPPVTVPVSINIVTPVAPSASSSGPTASSLIIPSVGHLDGLASQWRSDVRISNTGLQKANYLLRFTPAGGDPAQAKQTQISIDAASTTALDDIVKNWYGVGALGDAANGVLEIRPLSTAGKGGPVAEENVTVQTVASSRTFNQSAGGTLGQYIPAVPFSAFVGQVSGGDPRAGILSLQQIAQSPSYRTNLGIVEASGKPATVQVNVFDAAGKNVLGFPLDLKGGEQQQLNAFLAAKNITLADGRVEVKVTGGEGKVTAYASVLDNKTTDPLLVPGVPLIQTAARAFVLPGVADLRTQAANWQSDVRVFNAGTTPQAATLTFYPQTGSGDQPAVTKLLTIQPGEVKVLDNVLGDLFNLTNVGGALHVDTPSDANLVVTGRTYNRVDDGGTYGQFISAVTPAEGAEKGGRTLNLLQVEDSARYRTNLGIAEVSGKPVTVEVSVYMPGAKVAPTVRIPMAANEYRQFRVLQQMGIGTAYNARIAVRVVDGDGRATAYASVIDMQTQDPTYVPAQ